jgi:tetratricopeptide (TPR) repeat protein
MGEKLAIPVKIIPAFPTRNHMLEDKLNLIRSLIEAGDNQKALKLINQIEKKNKIEGELQLKLSRLYRGMSQTDKALKVLGPLVQVDATSSQLSMIELEIAILQATNLSRLGRKYLAYRILQQLDEYIHKHQLHFNRLELLYFNHHYANALIELGKIQEGLEKTLAFGAAIEKSMLSEEDTLRPRLYFHEQLARFYYSLGDIPKARNCIKKLQLLLTPDQEIWKVICLNRLGSYFLHENEIEEAFDIFKQVGEYFQKRPESYTGEQVYWYRMMAECYIKQNNLEQAKTFLQVMRKKVEQNEGSISPETWIAGLYYLNKVDPGNLSLQEKIALRCHPLSSYYSYLSGRSIENINIENLPYWCKTKLTENISYDVWIIDRQLGTIESAQYADIRQNLLQEMIEFQKPILDLFSGIESTSQLTPFTPIQHMSLVGLIGAGNLGVDKWSLMEFVYRQLFIDLDCGIDRLNKMISSLRRHGLHIDLRNNSYFLQDNYQKIIMPMHFHTLGTWHLFEGMKRADALDLLTRHCKVSQSTAKSWFSSWKKAA